MYNLGLAVMPMPLFVCLFVCFFLDAVLKLAHKSNLIVHVCTHAKDRWQDAQAISYCVAIRNHQNQAMLRALPKNTIWS